MRNLTFKYTSNGVETDGTFDFESIGFDPAIDQLEEQYADDSGFRFSPNIEEQRTYWEDIDEA